MMRQKYDAGPSGGGTAGSGAYQPSSPRPRSPMRRNGPGPGSPHPGASSAQVKAPVSLDAWHQGLLGTKQLDTVAKLAEWAKKVERGQDDEQQQGDVGDDSEVKAGIDVVDGTDEASPPVASSSKATLPSAPITSSSALLPWLESIKASQASSIANDPSHSSVASHSAALAQMHSAVQQTTELLTQLEQARINVAELLAGVKSVEETSEELREESERRGGRAESLLALAQELDVYLSYYNLLPQATSFLSSPSLSLVLTPTFPLILAQLDIGLSFIRAHPHFKDASLYRLRFEHCITRGGNLAKMWICGRWRELKDEAVGRLKEREKNLKGTGRDGSGAEDVESDIEAALMDFSTPSILQVVYSKFVAASPELSSVLSEVQKRCPPPSSTALPQTPQTGKLPTDEEALLADYAHQEDDEEPNNEAGTSDERSINTFSEFDTLLADIRNAYFDARRAIVAPLIASVLAKIETRAHNSPADVTIATSPLLIFTSRALVLLRSVLLSEALLYRETFGEKDASFTGQVALIEFLKSLSKDLIDRLHPRVFAESKVTTLAALAKTVLESCSVSSSQSRTNTAQSSYLLFSSQDPYDFSDVPTRYTMSTPAEETTYLLKPLALPLLQDIQTRLLYRSRAVLSGGDVAGYSPRGDGDELIELIKKIVRGEGVAEEKRGRTVVGRRGKRGRSSLGVGILKAAAERALQESEQEQQQQAQNGQAGSLSAANAGSGAGAGADQGSESNGTSAVTTLAPPTPRDSSPPDAPSIELFKPPPTEILATWYLPLIRAFTILSLLHSVLNRSEFAKVGVEALEKVRGAVQRGNDILKSKVATLSKKREKAGASAQVAESGEAAGEGSAAQAYEPDELDSALFALRNALLLREMSASVDLSLVQLSGYDRLEQRMGGGEGVGAVQGRAGLLDVGAVMKVMSGLLEGIGVASQASPASNSTASQAEGTTGPASSSNGSGNAFLSDVHVASTHLVAALRAKLPLQDASSNAWTEEVVVTLRIIRRRVALYIDDEEAVAGLLRSAVEGVTRQGDAELEGRIKERLAL